MVGTLKTYNRCFFIKAYKAAFMLTYVLIVYILSVDKIILINKSHLYMKT